MTPQQFQQSPHREKVELFLKSVDGQHLLNTLTAFQPPFSKNEIMHMHANENGKREGFEMCIRGIVLLSTQIQPKPQVDANYGVAVMDSVAK